MPDRRPSPALLLFVLVLACLAPVGALVATGLAGTSDGQVETADGGAHGDRSQLAGEVDRASGDVSSTTTATPGSRGSTSTTARPTTTASSAPPAPPTTSAPSTAPPTTAAPAPAPPPPPPSPAEQVVALANEARADAGCGPLRIDPALTAAAQAHSDDMAANGYFSHTSQDGRTFDQRIRAAGYTGGYLAENIAQGQDSAQRVHDAWMASDGHRRNILDCAFTDIGVGLNAGTWTWTQDFGG